MIKFAIKRLRRRALNLFVQELFWFDRRNQCWTPHGCISIEGMKTLVEEISSGRLNGEQAAGDIHA